MNLRLQLTFAMMLVFGAASPAQALDALAKSGYIDIPAQPLAQALHELAWQIHVQIICDPPDCRGISARHVVGTQTVGKALDALLRGSGLHYEALDSRSIAILSTVGPAPALNAPSRRNGTAPVQDQKSIIEESAPAEVLIRTGTNFSVGVAPFGPTMTYSRLALEESGAVSLGEFLSRLPQNLGSNSRATYSIGAAQNGEHGSSINLRGIGEQGTLILIDGHRVAESALGNFVDVSLIPVAVIDRLEILPEGAAAIYGADAVAGVVNIILRRSFNGIESDISNAWPAHSGANLFSVAQTLGKEWDSGSLVSSLTYHREQRLLSTDRSYSNTPGYTLLPALMDCDGYLSFHQDVSSRFHVDLDSLYSNRHTDDDEDYLWNSMRIGPYRQKGIANQYLVAPTLTWNLDGGWNVIMDSDISQNRFTEMSAYGSGAPSGAAAYSTLSEARVRTMDGRVDGPLVHLQTGDVRLALGLGERWEDYHSHGSTFESLAAGSLHRNVAAAYGELYLPLVGAQSSRPGLRKLDVRMAVRGERYPGGAGSTGNPKFDFLWQPIEHLSIRGSYGTSFTVAGYSQTLQAYNALAIERTPGPACAAGSCLVAEEFGASSSYHPERSKSYTVGFEWVPESPAGLHVWSNFYSIHYFDQIAAPPHTETLLANPAAFAGVIVTNPTPTFLDGVFARAATYPQGVTSFVGSYDRSEINLYIDQRTRNLAQTLAMGVDFDLGYDLPAPYGVWTIGLMGTRVLKLDDRASPGSPDVSVIDTFAHPLSRRYEGRIGLRASSGITFQLRTNYFGRYTNNQVVPAEPIASWMTFDAMLSASLDQIFTRLGPEAHLELSIDNMTDRDPPHVRTPLVPDGFDPVQANTLGRLIKLRFVVRL